MKKILLLVCLFSLLSCGARAQGSGTPFTLRVKVDANGYLLAAATAQTNPVTSSVFTNARLKTDASGNLLVVLVGGATITGGSCTNQFVSAISTSGVPTCSNTLPTLLGGSGTTSTLSLQSTSGAGTTGADIIFKTGNNGATEAGRLTNAGSFNLNVAGVYGWSGVSNGLATSLGQTRLLASDGGAYYILTPGNTTYNSSKVTFSNAGSPVFVYSAPTVTGQQVLTNGAESTGVGLDVATDGVLKLRGRAFTNNTGSLDIGSKVITYNNVNTAGWGVPSIYAAGRVTAQSAANSSIATYTVGAADGSFEISANMNVTAITTLVTTLTCTYTDESNTARTMVLPVAQLAGSFIASGAITGTGAWETPTMHIRAKASTVITILTSTGTFTGVTYTAEGIIKQMN